MHGSAPEDSARAAELVESGAEIAGAAAGGALGLIGGPAGVAAGAAGGVIVTRALKRVGAEIHQRLLAPRQRLRVGAAYAVAADEIRGRLAAGEEVRSDLFHAPPDGRSQAEEILEGVLLAAADSYEERKVPYLGRLYASVAFEPSVSVAHANYLTTLAERLTYWQLVALSIFAGDAFAEERAAASRLRSEGGGPGATVHAVSQLDELARLALLGTGGPGGVDLPVGSLWTVDPGSYALTLQGQVLHDLMGLASVRTEDQLGVLRDLGIAGSAEPPGGRAGH